MLRRRRDAARVAALSTQDPNAAERVLRREIANGSVAAAEALGDLLLAQDGRESEAEQLLIHAWLVDGSDSARQAVLQLMRKDDRWADFERACRAGVQAGRRDDLIELGIAIWNQEGRQAEAEAVFRTARAEGVRPGVALVNLGQIAGEDGRVEEAVDLLAQAAREGHREPAAMRLVKILEGGPRDAEVDGWHRVAIAEGNASAPAYLARRQWNRDDFDELEALYRLAIERGHGPAPCVELACLLRMREPHREREAVALLSEALRQQIRWNVLDSVARQRVVDSQAALWALTSSVSIIEELPASNPCTTTEFLGSVLTAIARMLKEAGRESDVIELYRGVVDRGRRDFLLRLAFAVKAHGNAADAKQFFERCVEADVESTTAMMNLGFMAERAEAKDEAIVWYERAMATGEAKGAPTALGRMLSGGARDGEVAALYRSAIAAGERNAAVLLARRLWIAGDTSELEELYSRAIALGRDDVRFELACALHELGASRELAAAATVRQALDRGTTVADIRYAVRQNQIAPASRIWLLQNVTALCAEFPANHASADLRFRARLFALLGLELREAGRPDDAWRAIEAAVGLGYLPANGYLGELAETAGDTAAAIRRYELAAQDGTNWPLMNLARLHYRLDHPHELRSVLARFVTRVKPEEISGLGAQMHKQGDTSIAMLFLREGLSTGGAPVRSALARVIVDQDGLTAEAEELFLEALDGGDGRAATNLGYLYQDRGDAAAAQAVYRRGVELDSRYCMYNLGEMLTELGRFDEAEQLLTRARERGVEEADEALEELRAAGRTAAGGSAASPSS